MKRFTRMGLSIGVLVAGLAFVEVSAARGEHRRPNFSGTFRGPHGQFSIHIGNPAYPVGSHVPYGHRIYRRSRYGYGFDSPAFYCRSHRLRHSHWVPVRRHHRRWVVVAQPVVIVDSGPSYGYPDDYDDGYYGDGYYGDSGYGDPYGGGPYYGDPYGGSRHVCWDACPTHHPRHRHNGRRHHGDDDDDD